MYAKYKYFIQFSCYVNIYSAKSFSQNFPSALMAVGFNKKRCMGNFQKKNWARKSMLRRQISWLPPAFFRWHIPTTTYPNKYKENWKLCKWNISFFAKKINLFDGFRSAFLFWLIDWYKDFKVWFISRFSCGFWQPEIMKERNNMSLDPPVT